MLSIESYLNNKNRTTIYIIAKLKTNFTYRKTKEKVNFIAT